MFCKIRKWYLSDAADLAKALSNKKIQDNLRDGPSVKVNRFWKKIDNMI